MSASKQREEERRYLEGPLICHKGGWGDTVPLWLLKTIPEARAGELTREKEGSAKMCSLEETMLYLYTASLTAPLTAEWTRVYLWVVDRVMRRHELLEEGETVWDMVGEQGDGERQEWLELAPSELGDLVERLRSEIRRAVVQGWKNIESKCRH